MVHYDASQSRDHSDTGFSPFLIQFGDQLIQLADVLPAGDPARGDRRSRSAHPSAQGAMIAGGYSARLIGPAAGPGPFAAMSAADDAAARMAGAGALSAGGRMALRAVRAQASTRPWGQVHPGGVRFPEHDRRAWSGTWQAQWADRRERIADRREQIADQREHFADRREQIADQRERDADQREAELDTLARASGQAVADRKARIREAVARSQASLARSWE